MGEERAAKTPWWWTSLAHAPALVVFRVNAVFGWNHFYVHAPYLHDSGWFSATIYRAGLMPRNPAVVGHDIASYWGWHPSIIVSLGSVLSYVFPGDRVDWYCLYQGAIYTPLAFASDLAAPADTSRSRSRSLPTRARKKCGSFARFPARAASRSRTCNCSRPRRSRDKEHAAVSPRPLACSCSKGRSTCSTC